jgi:hypothetical protein
MLMMFSFQNNGGGKFGCSLPPDTAAQRDFLNALNTGTQKTQKFHRIHRKENQEII